MKRKRRKASRPLDVFHKGENLGPVPMKTLPKDHEFRTLMKQREGQWQDTEVPGVRIAIVSDNRTALGLVQKIAPDHVARARKHVGGGGGAQFFGIIDQVHEDGSFAQVTTTRFILPDADDPDRLESGWQIAFLRGPIGMKAELHIMALAFAYKLSGGTAYNCPD